MIEESVVVIKGHRYRYGYDYSTRKTVYLGPVGEDAPALSEGDFMAILKRQYTSMEDIIDNPFVDEKIRERLAPGPTEVFYMKNFDWHTNVMFKEELPTIEQVKNFDEYAHLASIKETEPERIFGALQGDIWSPNGEARKMIEGKGIGHTSMSVGDVVHLPDGRWLVTAGSGFEEIGRD